MQSVPAEVEPPAKGPLPRVLASRRGRMWLVLAGALVIAALHHVLGTPHAPHDYFALQGGPWSDALAYHLAARDLLAGWGLRENTSFPVFLQAVRAPGYVIFLATVYGLGLGPAAVAWLQLVMHAITCSLVYRIGAGGFGERAGLVAAAVVALARTELDFCGLLLTESMSVVCLASAIWLTVRERPRLGWAGLAVGVASTARSVAIVLLPLLLGHALLRRRATWRSAALALAVGVLPLGAIAARNALVVGTFSPAATYHVWTTWAEFVPPDPDSNDQHFTAFVPLAGRSEAEMQRIFRRETLAYVRAQPLRTLRRAYHLFESNFRLPAEQAPELTGLLLLPLLLLALGACFRARDRSIAALLGAFVMAFLGLTALLGESSGRFRVPVDFALALLTVGGLLRALRLEGAAVTENLPMRNRRVALLGVAALALALLVVPLVRAAHAPAADRIEVEPARLGAQALSFDDYARALFSDPTAVEGRLVAWPGVIDRLAHYGPGRGDGRSALLGPRPYGRTIATFQVDGAHGPLDGRRVFLEIPDELGYSPPARARAVVKARIETNLADPSRERPRLVAVGITPL